MESFTEIDRSLLSANDFVRWGATCFNKAGLVFGHGTDNALDEAAVLVYFALRLPFDAGSELLDAALTEAEKKRIYDLFKTRIEDRKPAAYLTGQAWFAGLRFYVDERALIPRSPIAELIETEFSPWLSAYPVTNILDMCTGSGCIAIACAMQFSKSNVDAVDISADALDLARKNADYHAVSERVTLVQSNGLAELKNRCYDLVVCNPPYVDAREMADLAPEFRHEPRLGLAAGSDGLDFVTQFLAEISSYLKPEGLLVVEVGNSAEALEARYPNVPFMWVDFARGGDGVFVFTKPELDKYQDVFSEIRLK
ncbi:MAG: 50S ribosomal protein L3 N(5)-glutamine methyltransferase [Gammaproteobacteria bacterium]|nr:50S ribosomal protein L3 N(5)-glutamine methyltransferase [Gammaproteobacteria bacterium]